MWAGGCTGLGLLSPGTPANTTLAPFLTLQSKAGQGIRSYQVIKGITPYEDFMAVYQGIQGLIMAHNGS